MSEFFEDLAESLDAEPELVPHLPELFRDLDELAVRATDVLEILAGGGFERGGSVLDLGCGKGAACLAVARAFGATALGIDGMPEFVLHAAEQARRLDLSSVCRFQVGDLRAAVDRPRKHDLVMLLGLGAIFGDTASTMGVLRRCVRPGGFVLLDEAFRTDGSTLSQAVDLLDEDGLVRALEAHGDTVIARRIVDTEANERWCRAATQSVLARARRLAARYPELAEPLLEFAERQRRETASLTSAPLVGALWLVRVGATSQEAPR